MHKELENELWESFLRAAVIQNSLDEIKTYPSKNELNHIAIPDQYDSKIHRLIKHYNYKIKFRSALKYCRKIASIILIIMGISFSILLQNDNVRAACQNVIVKIFDRYVRFTRTTDLVSNNTTIKLGYIPEGFSLIEASSSEAGNFIIYENSNGDFIELEYDTQKHTSYIDNEHYRVLPIQINTVKGTFFESQNDSFMNILIWNTPAYYFQLTSSLGKEELIKLAKNIK